jgi:RNA polymerase sigma-70 factor (ECF subfamily)
MKPPSDDATSAYEDRSFPPIDRSIVERVRRREREALGQFFEHYFDRVFGLALRLLGQRMAAQDATQEVFFKALRASEQLDPERDPAPWLITITLNTCRSFWRSSTHRMAKRSVPLGPGTDPHLEIPDASRNPAELAAASEREMIVQEAIQTLHEKSREVIILRDYQGLDHKEISRILGMTQDAVRKRYSRALAELARLLKGRVE